jgi:hypothetical protein
MDRDGVDLCLGHHLFGHRPHPEPFGIVEMPAAQSVLKALDLRGHVPARQSGDPRRACGRIALAGLTVAGVTGFVERSARGRRHRSALTPRDIARGTAGGCP